MGFNTFAENPVNCVTGIWTNTYNADEIVKIMRSKYKIELAPSGGILKEKLFRIGNYGNINKLGIDKLVQSLKLIIESMRIENDRK